MFTNHHHIYEINIQLNVRYSPTNVECAIYTLIKTAITENHFNKKPDGKNHSNENRKLIQTATTNRTKTINNKKRYEENHYDKTARTKTATVKTVWTKFVL